MKFTLILSAAAIALSLASPTFAQVMTAKEYVGTAGASDLYERQASQIVLQSTADPKVREFATMMLSTHAQSAANVKAAAGKSGVKASPPMLMPAQAEMIAQLRTEKGTARDAAYIAQQRAAHGQALSVQKAYAAEGTVPTLKMAAGKIVPVVEHHIMMLAAM